MIIATSSITEPPKWVNKFLKQFVELNNLLYRTTNFTEYDKTFVRHARQREVFLLQKLQNNRTHCPEVKQYAVQLLPNYESTLVLGNYPKVHAIYRSVLQYTLKGKDLNSLANLALTYEPSRTSAFIDMADELGIPVVNLSQPNWYESLEKLV